MANRNENLSPAADTNAELPSWRDLTLEEKVRIIADLRPIDDIFFEVLADDKAVCQEILCTIMEDPGLIVEDVIVQSSVRNLYGRSVRLDALCILGSGTKVNIEVQRADNDDHFRRIWLNQSVITAKETDAGEKFAAIPELYVVYISEFDIIGQNKTTYHIDKVVRETGKVIDDGSHIICVNTVNDDGSDIADLMSCFTKKQVNNPKFPNLSERVRMLKETEGGTESMCKVMQRYEDAALVRGINIGEARGEARGENRGYDKLSELMNSLFKANRLDDARRVSSDPEYRKQMLAEFQLSAEC